MCTTPPFQAFRSGLHIPASLFADFEDWRMGTFGWTLRGAPDPRSGDYSQGNDVYEASSLPRGGHFDPRNFTSLGPRVSVEVNRRGVTCCWFVPRTSCVGWIWNCTWCQCCPCMAHCFYRSVSFFIVCFQSARVPPSAVNVSLTSRQRRCQLRIVRSSRQLLMSRLSPLMFDRGIFIACATSDYRSSG